MAQKSKYLFIASMDVDPEKEDLLGKVWVVYWPLSEVHLMDSFSSLAQGALRQVPWP